MSRPLEIVAAADEPTIVMRRAFAAPRGLVFDAFTSAEHLPRWLGPRSMTTLSCEIDLRVGGRWRFVHRAGNGHEFAFHGVYREVARPVRVVRTVVFEPMPDAEAVETLELDEQGGETVVTSTTRHRTFEARDAHLASGMESGVREGYQRLDELLAAQANTVLVSREFAAPRGLVFDVWTRAEHLDRWFGPTGCQATWTIDRFAVGASFTIRMRGDGFDHLVRGVYREIDPPRRLAWTFRFDDAPDVEVPMIVTFDEAGGGARTLLTARQDFPTFDRMSAADAAVLRPRLAGSSIGWSMTLDNLAAYVAARR